MTDHQEAIDPLAGLKVIDRLEVGPVRVERQRLVAPYTVHQHEQTDTFEFIDRFEEDVFTPGEFESVNLAGMLAAQVALNYGLFCGEIVFHGPFDRYDRQLLEDMAENTAREIYVNKFLMPNPFLKPSFRDLPVVKRDRYCRASLVFPDLLVSPKPKKTQPWSNGQAPIAVLSSGGKESLLSYGLLQEMGQVPHAVFINESGKHWFTALNGYRYFAENYPRTARVWTNSDRLFAWMLRHLPFIREDFATLRSDKYPIRLWTVALFLFSALPVLRKRGIGRLVIGDEFDTTVRTSYHGITHYDGLYDQSRYFDHGLTRYFQRKGWQICQFSMMRTLSELLVEKVLVERYPELQRQQMSCHAAHIEEQRVRPCGQCEKCSRVVGMLVALGADPSECGYTPAQIEKCLAHLANRGVSQETKAQEHLAWLLAQQNRLPGAKAGTAVGRRRPEVMKLRFDPERSPMEDLPVDLREPLFRLLVEHAEGAIKRTGRVWTDFDPLSDPAVTRPYAFERAGCESPRDGRPPHATINPAAKPYLLAELTWPEAQQRFKEVDLALLPVGAVEQHGPHLTLDTDAFDADYLCRAVAERCSDPKPLVLPLIPYGVSYHHDDFAGTISIGPDTLAKLVHEVGMSAARHGITKLVIVNGHGGNVPSLQFAAQMINRDAHIFTCVESGETSDADIEHMSETPNDVHAGEVETSTSLAVRPDLVQMDKAEKFVPRFSSKYLDFTHKRSVDWYARTEKISPTGVLGDATKATREKGERMWAVMIEHLVAFVDQLKTMSLDEIHQKSRI